MEAGLKQLSTFMFSWSLTLMVEIITYEQHCEQDRNAQNKTMTREGKTKTKTKTEKLLDSASLISIVHVLGVANDCTSHRQWSVSAAKKLVL